MKIYALMSRQLVLYVGKTKQTLKDRERSHRSVSNHTTSKYIPDWIDWEIKLLEEVPDDQTTTKEQHYYDTLKPLYNRQRPGQSHEEWKQTEAGKKSLKARSARYNASEHGKQVTRARCATEDWIERRKLQRNTDEGRAQRNEYQRAYRAAKKATQSL